jgi:hypothetical protein
MTKEIDTRILSLNSLHTSDRSDRWYSIETTAWINSRPGMATTTGSGTTPLYAVFRVAVGSPRLPTIQAAINTFVSTKEPSIPLRDTEISHQTSIRNLVPVTINLVPATLNLFR